MSEVAFRSRGFLKIGRSKLGVCLYVALRQDVAARHKVVPWSMSAYVVFPREEISGGGSGIILRTLSSWSEKVKVSNLLGYVEPSRAIALCISMYFAKVYFFKGVAFKFGCNFDVRWLGVRARSARKKCFRFTVMKGYTAVDPKDFGFEFIFD